MTRRKEERWGVGIVGLGLAGGFMAPILAAHPCFGIAGAFDPDPGLRARFTATGLPADATIEALLQRPDIDLVYIASPHRFHAAQTVMALQAGKHVVVEKPMALTVADCDRMIAAARAADRLLVVGHTHGFDPAPRAMGDLIAAGKVGPLALVTTVNFTDFLYRPRRPEELDPARGGGIFFNQLPHQIDMVRVIARRPVVRARCLSGVIDPARPVQGHLAALLTFDGGAAASIVYNGHDRFDSDVLHDQVSETGYPKRSDPGAARRALAQSSGADEASKRTALGFGSDAFRSLTPPPHQPHFGLLVASCRDADLRASTDGLAIYEDAGMREVRLSGTPGFAGHVALWDEVAGALAGDAPALQDGVFGRETIAICHALLRSARDGRDVAPE